MLLQASSFPYRFLYKSCLPLFSDIVFEAAHLVIVDRQKRLKYGPANMECLIQGDGKSDEYCHECEYGRRRPTHWHMTERERSNLSMVHTEGSQSCLKLVSRSDIMASNWGISCRKVIVLVEPSGSELSWSNKVSTSPHRERRSRLSILGITCSGS